MRIDCSCLQGSIFLNVDIVAKMVVNIALMDLENNASMFVFNLNIPIFALQIWNKEK